jgi:hypothetical protein
MVVRITSLIINPEFYYVKNTIFCKEIYPEKLACIITVLYLVSEFE